MDAAFNTWISVGSPIVELVAGRSVLGAASATGGHKKPARTADWYARWSSPTGETRLLGKS